MASRAIRPSTTQSTLALWFKSLLNALLFFGLFMVALPAVAYRLLPAVLSLPRWLSLGGGGVLFTGGLLVWLACLDAFSRHGHGTPFPLDAPRDLVTAGFYRVVRNPIMVGELAVIWGEGLMFSSPAILLYAAAVTLIAHVVVIRIEEPELRARFGAQYDDYCRQVPRWVPSLSLRHGS